MIDTADIDVSSPRILSQNGNPPRNRLRRDRPTIKIRSQALKDNPALRQHNERHEKSVGELLMEKFFIKDKKSDGDGNQQGIRLYHQINLDRLEDSQEREAVQKRITRRLTRRRSSADLQLDPEQIQREAAYAQAQAKVLDNLVAEEQAQIENEARRGTLVFKKCTTARGPIIERSYYANNVDSDTMTQEEEEAITRIRKCMKKTKKKKRSSIDKLLSTDKIDNRPSTFSEISTDSQAEEDNELRSQMYKIEACNSAGDFSTIWVNRSSKDEKFESTVEQFKENVGIFVPKKFGNKTDVSSNNTDDAETQVVLKVQKPYVKDPSRNSVYLTMRKPTEKLNEKLEEVNKFKVKIDEDQLTNGFVDVENDIFGNNTLKDLTDEDSVEPNSNSKIQIANDTNKDKALKKTVYEPKKVESLAKKDVYSVLNNNLWDERDSISAKKNDMQKIITGDTSFLRKKAEIAANPIESNVSINVPKDNSQMEYLRETSEDIFIKDIKNDESQKSHDSFDTTEKTFYHLEVDSSIKMSEVFAIKISDVSVGRDKLVVAEDRPKLSALSYDEDTIKRIAEADDNVDKNRASGVMLTTNSVICCLPKLSKINTDRNNAVEAPKLSLETAECLANSLKSDQDVIGAAAIELPGKKVNKTSNLAQVFSFEENASKRTSGVDADKSTFRIDGIRHDDVVKLEAKETTLSKEINDKVYSNKYFEEAKLATDVKQAKDVSLTKILRDNVKRTDGNVLSLKMVDSSKTEVKVIVTEATADALKKAELLKTDVIKKNNQTDIGKDSLKDLSSHKNKPKFNNADLKFCFKAETLLKNDVNESSIANSSKTIGKNSSTFKTPKIGDNKSLFHNDAAEKRVLKKNISVDSSKVMNDRSSNKISQQLSVDEKATDNDVSVKMSETKSYKITEKKSIRLDTSCNLQDENVVLSRSTSTESIDFWSEIKAPGSPEAARSKQSNRSSFHEVTPSTSKVEAKMNLINSKWKDSEKENEIDIKMNIAGLKNSIVGSSNILEEETERIVSESLRVKEAKITKPAKTMKLEKNMPKISSKKKKNLSVAIDVKDTNSTIKKISLKRNDSGAATSVITPIEVAVPIIKIVEAPKLPDEPDNRKVDEEHEDPSTPTNELSPDLCLIRKISRWSNQDDLTNTGDVDTPLASEETSLTASPSFSPQTSKTKRVIKKKKASTKKQPSEKSERGPKNIQNGNELTMMTNSNQQNTLTTIKLVPEKQQLAKPSPKTSPKSSLKNTPLQRPLDLIRMFYTTPSALLTATPRDLSKVRRAKIKRRRHHSRTPSISSDSTGSTTSTATGSTDENGSIRVELDDDSEHKRMNSTRSNDSGFDGSPRISSIYIACASKFCRQTHSDSFQIFFLRKVVL